MKNDILITSPVEIHKKNYKYLSYSCLNLLHNTKAKDILIRHPWNNQKNYLQDSIKIKKIYLHVLKKISLILNDYHKIKKDLRYWKILIGPWLHSFIVVYYEKNLLIEDLLRNKRKLIVPVVDFKIKNQIPKDFFTFFSDHVYSSNWNDYFFSFIISKKKLNQNIIKRKKIILNQKKFEKNKTFNFFNHLRKLLLNFINIVFLFRIRNQSLVFFNTNLSFKNNLFLIFKNFSFPFLISQNKNNIYPDMPLRESLSKAIKDNNNFYNEILKMSILNIPTDLLENFSHVGEKIFRSNVTRKPKVIFTANGILPSSFQTRYIAECISNGTKLILAQHGGRYGNIKIFFHTEHEVDISDHFISWGRKKNNIKIKNFGIIKPFKNFGKDNNQKQKILFLMMSKGRFTRVIDSETNIKKLYNYYHNICPNFYSVLARNFRNRLIYRSSANNYWNEKEILMKKCQLAQINFDRHKSDLFQIVETSRIVVCSYLSTTFMELMSSNKPVILFIPYSHESYNAVTLKILNIMEKSRIYYRSHAEAAKFINKNWKNIDEWWFSKKVQKSRKIFLDYFSIVNPRIIKDIQQLIDHSKKQYLISKSDL